MASNPIRWFEIYVQDLPRAKKFYEALFDIELKPLDSPAAELWGFPGGPGMPGAAGALVKMEGFDSGRNSCLVYFGCEDCAVQANRAVENGGRVQRGKFSIGQYGFAALIYDTEGNMIGLHSLQ